MSMSQDEDDDEDDEQVEEPSADETDEQGGEIDPLSGEVSPSRRLDRKYAPPNERKPFF